MFDHAGGDIGRLIQFLGEDAAHPRQLIARKDVQDFEHDVADPAPLVPAQLRGEARDLARQLATHLVVAVADECMVRLDRRQNIGGHGTAYPGVDILRKKVKDFRLHIAPRGKPPPRERRGVTGDPLGPVVVDRPPVSLGPEPRRSEFVHAEARNPAAGPAAA